MKHPLFSIIIPAYNNSNLLIRCLKSISNQSFSDWEVIVVIDGSRDNCFEIASSYSSSDSRFHAVNKTINEGTHRARMSGVETARGKYLMFVDADDEIEPDGLALLSKAIEDEAPFDVLHFGQRIVRSGMDDEACKAAEALCNADIETLVGPEISESSFSFDPTRNRQDWRVLQRVFRTELVKDVFEGMVKDRMGVGEDAYEWFCISTSDECKREVFRNDLIIYVYSYGTGVTNTQCISLSELQRDISSYQSVISATHEWSNKVASHAVWLSDKMAEILIEQAFSLIQTRVAASEYSAALSIAENEFGGFSCIPDLYRLARDAAYEAWVTDESYSPDAIYARLFEEGRRLEKQYGESKAASKYKEAAFGHIHDLKKRTISNSGLTETKDAQDSDDNDNASSIIRGAVRKAISWFRK